VQADQGHDERAFPQGGGGLRLSLDQSLSEEQGAGVENAVIGGPMKFGQQAELGVAAGKRRQ
jgi:hypothetical protein